MTLKRLIDLLTIAIGNQKTTFQLLENKISFSVAAEEALENKPGLEKVHSTQTMSLLLESMVEDYEKNNYFNRPLGILKNDEEKK